MGERNIHCIASRTSAIVLNSAVVPFVLGRDAEVCRMPRHPSSLLAWIALILSLLSAVTIVPLWIPIVLLSLSVLLREGVRLPS